MAYDEDDFVDYDDYGGDPVDEVLAEFGNKVTENEAVAALEAADYDVDAAIIALNKRLADREKARAKAQAAAKPPPAAQKGKLPLAGAPAPRASGGSADLPNEEQNHDSGDDLGANTRSGASILELVRARREQEHAAAPVGSVPQKSGSALSALSKLRSRKAGAGASAETVKPASASRDRSESPAPPSAALKALERLRARKLGSASTNDGSRDASDSELAVSRAGTPQQRSVSPPEPSFEVPTIVFTFQPTPRPTPSRFGSILGSSFSRSTKGTISNAVATDSKMAGSFSKESPDDRILNAQNSAFTKTEQPKAAAPVIPKNLASTKPKDKLLSDLTNLRLKPRVSFVVIGHVDAGKSTLMGRMLLDTGAINQRVIDQHTHDSSKIGKTSFAMAWVMDSTTEERNRGVTVDVGEAFFETPEASFTVLDAPGHKDYVPNMIAGVAQADVAVLVVDSDTNAFESGFSLDGQTKEHAILARSLGIESLVIAVNKLDTQDWSEERFNDIKTQLTDFLKRKVNYDERKLTFVPTSGKSGAYVVKSSKEATWYQGPTLIQALTAQQFSQRDASGPFRFLVTNAYNEDYRSTIGVFGRVLSGAIEQDDPVVNSSEDDAYGTVKELEGKHAVAGDVVELKLDLSLDKCRPGDVLTSPEDPIEPTQTIKAKVILFEMKKPLLQGSRLSFYMGRVNESVRISRISALLDNKGNVQKKKPRHLIKGQMAQITLEIEKPIVVLPFKDNKDLGRFVLRLDGKTIGGGVIDKIVNSASTPAESTEAA